MYLAARIGRWSTTEIGRFYNGRDHSTVCYGIQRVESLRESNPEVDAVLTQLKEQLANGGGDTEIQNNCLESDAGCPGMSLEEVADRIAQRIWTYLEERLKTDMRSEQHAVQKRQTQP
jgi:Bacterial dnaA protein helix-turn-helix